MALLLKEGQDVNQRHRGKTALMWAIEEENTDTATSLLKHGASVTNTDDRGRTAVHYVACGAETTLRLMPMVLKAGGVQVINRASTDNGDTALHCAARSGDWVTVRILRVSGADLSVQNNAGQTPYDVALASGDLQLATSIISKEGRLLQCPRPLASPPKGERTAEDACHALQFELDTSISESTETCRPIHRCVHKKFSYKQCIKGVGMRTKTQGDSCRKACPLGPRHPYCKVWCGEELWRPLEGLFEVCAKTVAGS